LLESSQEGYYVVRGFAVASFILCHYSWK